MLLLKIKRSLYVSFSIKQATAILQAMNVNSYSTSNLCFTDLSNIIVNGKYRWK